MVKGRRLPSLFSTVSERFHSQLRRCVNSAFSMSTLIQYEPFVDSTTELFLSQTEKIYADSRLGCNFSRWLQFYAFDVIGEITYSKRHGFLEENKDIDGIIDYIAGLFDYVGPVLRPFFLISTPEVRWVLLTVCRLDKYPCSIFYSSKIHCTSLRPRGN